MELFAQVVLEDIKAGNNEVRKSIEGLSGEALNWRPAGEDSNTLYALVTHMLGAQRFMVANAVGKRVERDRAAEFAAKGGDVAPLLAAFDKAEAEIEEWLSSMTLEDLAKPRLMLGNEVPAARCLTSAIRHLGEHVGHATLTRQLWDERFKAEFVTRPKGGFPFPP